MSDQHEPVEPAQAGVTDALSQRDVAEAQTDGELKRIVGEEEGILEKVLTHLQEKMSRPPEKAALEPDYEAAMIDLRDQVSSARLEDIPPLLEQMERLQSLASRKRESTEMHVDARSPYFGHLVLQEGERKREVLIGRSTYLDTDSGIRIVDWRDAPVSRLYYRYDEGDDYDEIFGDREVEGEVLTRRAVTIVDGHLRRIGAPQGSFVRMRKGGWRRLESGATRLEGGQGSAIRAEHHKRRTLGVGADDGREDKSLREITALIDARQFDLISRPESGLVVIQGGAGSGKTTIGLHRLAYLTYQDKRRFRPDKMLVVVFNDALARYIGMVLPALDVEGVAIRTYEDWASKLRSSHVPKLPRRYCDDTPVEVTRLKKHPRMLELIEAKVRALEAEAEEQVESALATATSSSKASREAAAFVRQAWVASQGKALSHRLHTIGTAASSGLGAHLPTSARVVLERLGGRGMSQARDVVTTWADMLSDETLLRAHFQGALAEPELKRAIAWCSTRCADVVGSLEERLERDEESRARRASGQTAAEQRESDEESPGRGVDGREVDDEAALDREDDTLLLRLVQRLRGPLVKGGRGKEVLVYEHVLIDEAQDLSPVELAVVLDTVSKQKSVTLAGDVAQRLHMDNGFTDWETVLSNLGLSHVHVEPLKLSYRSTLQITDFAHAVLGPLAPEEKPQATRAGAPVEIIGFAHSGDTVSFLAESLRELMQGEPLASVALVSRYPEQADIYYDGLRKAEVPRLRRIAEQDFPFKPGIDVTDIRQVKGLEFDYVVLLEVSESSYPEDDEARHLLHIGATRAAHQLWVLTTGTPSRLIPEPYLDDAI